MLDIEHNSEHELYINRTYYKVLKKINTSKSLKNSSKLK